MLFWRLYRKDEMT